jgi:hypothetical protein
MFAIIAKSARSKLAGVAKLTTGERAELYNTMAAHADTFSVEGKTATHCVDISWNENWTGTDQLRNVRLERGRLHITSDPLAHSRREVIRTTKREFGVHPIGSTPVVIDGTPRKDA